MTGPEAVNALPDMIRVGPHDYRIEKWPVGSKSDCFGDHDFTEQRIGIDMSLASSHRAVAVLMHEIGHAFFKMNDLDAADPEERIVHQFGIALAQLFRDNPWLAPWIAEASA